VSAERREAGAASCRAAYAAKRPSYAGCPLGLSSTTPGDPNEARHGRILRSRPCGLVPTPRSGQWVTGRHRRPSQCRQKMSITENAPQACAAAGIGAAIDDTGTISARSPKFMPERAGSKGGSAQASWLDRGCGMISDPAAITSDRGGAAGAPISRGGASEAGVKQAAQVSSWAS